MAVVLQLFPELEKSLKNLHAQKEELIHQKETLAQHVIIDEHQIVEQMDQKIKKVDDEVQKAFTVDSDAIQAAMDMVRAQAEMELYALEQKIRAKEIVLKALTERYNEQLVKNAERASNVLDITFDQAQLDRTNQTLAQIDDRILAVRSEQRAPGQIIPLTKAVSSLKRGW